MVTPAASATRLASERPTSAASGRTWPPGRSVRSRPSNPAGFADVHAWVTVRSARLAVKRTNFTAFDPSGMPVHGCAVAGRSLARARRTVNRQTRPAEVWRRQGRRGGGRWPSSFGWSDHLLERLDRDRPDDVPGGPGLDRHRLAGE